MTAEAQSHSQQSRVSSVADPDCIRLDICRWENEGGALIGNRIARSAAVSYTAKRTFKGLTDYATD